MCLQIYAMSSLKIQPARHGLSTSDSLDRRMENDIPPASRRVASLDIRPCWQSGRMQPGRPTCYPAGNRDHRPADQEMAVSQRTFHRQLLCTCNQNGDSQLSIQLLKYFQACRFVRGYKVFEKQSSKTIRSRGMN